MIASGGAQAHYASIISGAMRASGNWYYAGMIVGIMCSQCSVTEQ